MNSSYSTFAKFIGNPKMFLKLSVLLALVSLVRTAVIINVFEDGEVKATHSLRDCNARQCDNFCRKAGFRMGTCVGNRCRCTSYADFTVAEDKAGHSLSGSCNYRACDQLCRRLGFPGGACVGDKCDCDNFKPIDKTEDKIDHISLKSCNYQACDQVCRRLGFPGGTCVGNKCKCYHVEPVNTKENKDSFIHTAVETCNYQACDQLCRRLGFPGGACVGDRCKCDNFEPINTKEADQAIKPIETEQKNVEEVADNTKTLKDALNAAVGYCDLFKCDDMCYRLNYAGGSCVQGSCECY